VEHSNALLISFWQLDHPESSLAHSFQGHFRGIDQFSLEQHRMQH
jgi:hypothetical protein